MPVQFCVLHESAIRDLYACYMHNACMFMRNELQPGRQRQNLDVHPAAGTPAVGNLRLLLSHLTRIMLSLQGCASDRLIDTSVLGGPKVFVVATLASSRPAAPFAFRNYEVPDEAGPAAAALAACAGSCKHHVWEVRSLLAEIVDTICVLTRCCVVPD